MLSRVRWGNPFMDEMDEMDEGWSSAMSVISTGNNESNCEKASYFQILMNFSSLCLY